MASSTEPRRPRFSYAFVAKSTLVVLLVYGLASMAWMARDIVFVGFLGILFGLFLSLGADRLDSYMPRWAAAILTFLAFLALLTGFFFLVWPSVQSQLATIRTDVPTIIDDVTGWFQEQYRAIMGSEAEGEVAETVQRRMGQEAAGIVAGALPLLNTAMGAVAGLLVVIFTGLFLAANPGSYRQGMLALLPVRGRERVAEALDQTSEALRRWIGGVVIAMVAIFLLTTGALWLLGVPAFLALGLIAGLLELIPFVGPILSAIPAIALGLTVSPTMGLWVTLLYIGVQQIEGNLLTPLIMRQAVSLRPALVLLFQMAMSVLFGFIGLLVAVPLLVVIRIFVKRLYVDRLEASGSEAR